MKLKRRVFIKKSMLASAGVALGAPAYIKGYAQVKPSDMINVAICGLNGRGGSHVSNFLRIPDTRIVALCDPVDYVIPPRIESIEKAGQPKPTKIVADYRQLMDDKDIDIISIATPAYWHGLIAIAACQAGKDVYCEKPLAFTVEEGRKVVQATEKYNRIVQLGTQHRSNRVTQKAWELLKGGIIGDIYMGRGTEYKRRYSIGRKPDGPVPKGVNWDLFRGPAPMIPFNENHFFYNWHWYWDTTTTEHGNNGVHWMDQVRTGMGITGYPTKIACTGGFYSWDSDQEVPNFQVSTYEYADKKIMELEIRCLPNPGGSGQMEWYGNLGYAYLQGSTFQVWVTDGADGQRLRTPANISLNEREPASVAGTPQPTDIPQRARSSEPTLTVTMKDLPPDQWYDECTKARIEPHFMNFVDCVKSRRSSDLAAPIQNGHISTAQMHLGNIAYRTGRLLTFDGKTEKFVNDKEADSYLTRKDGYRSPWILPRTV